MTSIPPQIETIAWPLSLLGDLLENLASRSNLQPNQTRLPHPPPDLAEAGDEILGSWIDTAAGHLGIEAEGVDSLYIDIDRLMLAGGPMVLRLPGSLEDNQPRFVALLGARRGRVKIITPDLKVKRVRLETLRHALTAPYEGKLGADIQAILSDAGSSRGAARARP